MIGSFESNRRAPQGIQLYQPKFEGTFQYLYSWRCQKIPRIEIDPPLAAGIEWGYVKLQIMSVPSRARSEQGRDESQTAHLQHDSLISLLCTAAAANGNVF